MLVRKYFHLVDWDIARKKLTHPDLFSVREVSAMLKLNGDQTFFEAHVRLGL